jgi:hypothetical protein
MQTELTCNAIGDIGKGTARITIDDQLRRAIADTNARGQDGKVRKVKIEIVMTLDDDEIVFAASALFAPPAFVSDHSRGTVGKGQALLFDLAEEEEAA